MRASLCILGLALAGLTASAAVPVPPTLVPGNVLTNPGFEQGFTGWTQYNGGAPNIVTTAGAHDTATGVLVREAYSGHFVRQDFVPLDADILAFQFSADVVANAMATCVQTARIAPEYIATGGSQFNAWVQLGHGQVGFRVYGGALAQAPMPEAGAWHDYRVVLVRPLSVGLLLVDGELIMVTQGDAEGMGPPILTMFGDTAGSNANNGCGPAPDVAWDEVYVGTRLP